MVRIAVNRPDAQYACLGDQYTATMLVAVVPVART